MRGVKALLAAVVAMGLLIMAGTAVLVATVIKRLVHPPAQVATARTPGPAPAAAAVPLLVDQPPETRIAAAIRQSDTSLALLLTGGGLPDRLVVWDELSGRIVARASLGR